MQDVNVVAFVTFEEAGAVVEVNENVPLSGSPFAIAVRHCVCDNLTDLCQSNDNENERSLP